MGSRQGTLKEESSDESTIISSQTSTLTRNMGTDNLHQVNNKNKTYFQNQQFIFWTHHISTANQDVHVLTQKSSSILPIT